MIGAPDDFIFTQGRAALAQPTPDKEPRHNRIKKSGEGKNRNFCGAGHFAKIASGDESEAMDRGLPIQFRAARDKFLDVRPGFRRAAISKAGKLRVTEHDSRQ